ncbi:MAG: hypothetical protein ONB25_09440 [candidate division KSB1 bacterium]|nr:hypothetical protein [candidate division KSB1 bacterium]MDZ7412428.1 hypothetical protein [candidate division KSB1 bacterium]
MKPEVRRPVGYTLLCCVGVKKVVLGAWRLSDEQDPGVRDRSVFLFLTVGFALFYTVQVPLSTSSADVVAFVLRSNAASPILRHAYLDARTLQGAEPLPNYHLAHTCALWLTYKCAPGWLRHTAAPAGFFSAFCGGLVVGLTYLIWVRLSLCRREAIAAACVAGLIPSLWYHSLIGEVYVPQLACVMLVVVFFLYSRPLLAGIAFLLATLVSPLAALCFPLVLLRGWDKKALRDAIVAGAVALAGYVGTHWAVGNNPLGFLRGLAQEAVAKSVPYKLLSLTGIVALNLHVMLFLLLKGFRAWSGQNKASFLVLLVVVVLHLLLPLVSADFLVDKGCFLLPVFWAVSMPIGLALVCPGRKWWQTLGVLVVTVTITEAAWFLPSQHFAKATEEVGLLLRARFGQHIKVMGDWGTALPIVATVNGWDYERVATHYYDVPTPGAADLLATGQDSLLVAVGRKPALRRIAGKVPLPGFRVQDHVPHVPSEAGTLEKLFAGENFDIYLWTAPH